MQKDTVQYLHMQPKLDNQNKKSLKLDEVALIALTAAATFSILDTYVPSMAVSARSGAGFGIGANLVGFPGGL